MARSSTRSEAQQFGNTLDAHEFIKLLFLGLDSPKYELLNVDPLLKTLETAIVSDSKNAYDALKRIENSGLQMEENRTAV